MVLNGKSASFRVTNDEITRANGVARIRHGGYIYELTEAALDELTAYNNPITTYELAALGKAIPLRTAR